MANEDIREVVISDIPSDTDEQDLCLYLEDEKGGGGTIEKIQYDEASRTAVVEFKRFEVARRLLEAKKFYISAVKRHVTISSRAGGVSFDTRDRSDEKFESDEDDYLPGVTVSNSWSDQQGSCSVFIEDVSKDMRDFLGVVIESKFGECHIEPDDLLGGILVTFREAEGATKLLAAGHVEFNNSLLSVVLPPRNNQQQQPHDDRTMRKVLVRGFPASLSSSTLIEVLESPKAKGGAVEEICDRSQDSAVVTFREAEVAERLIETGEATFGKSVLRFSRPPVRNIEEDFSREPSVNDEQTSSFQGKSGETKSDTSTSCTVNVTNIPKKLLKEGVLKIFFENSSRSGGGMIENMSLSGDSATATVTFKDSQVAKSLLERREVKYLDGSILYIVPLTTDVKSSGRQDNKSYKKSRLPEPRTIEVTELTKEMNEDRLTQYLESKTKSGREAAQLSEPRTVEVIGYLRNTNDSVELLKLFFESTKSGGGPIEDVEEQGDRIFLTFYHPADARNVASRKHVVIKTPVQVRLLELWPKRVSHAILVRGVDDRTSETTLRAFFENKQRTNGGHIKDFFKDEDTGNVVITFQDGEVAKSVASRRQLSLNDCQLNVELMKPGRPPPFLIEKNGELVAKDKLLYVDLPPVRQPDLFRGYVSAAASAEVMEVCFSTKPDVALVKYRSQPDYQQVLLTLCTEPYRGCMISVERLYQTRTIQVHNIRNLMKDTILYHFESSRYGGGEVKNLEYHPEDGYALIEFADLRVMESVLFELHVIDEMEVSVSPYYPCLGVLPSGFDHRSPFPKIPPDVLLEVDKHVMFFAQKNKSFKEQIEKLMESKYCHVQWPDESQKSCQLTLSCTVSPSQPNAHNIIQKWRETCCKSIETESKKVKLIRKAIPMETWNQLKDRVEAAIKPTDNNLLIHWNDKKGLVSVCGFFEKVDEYDKKFSEIETELKVELEKSKLRITETWQLKSHVLALLKQFIWNEKTGDDVTVNFLEDAVEIVGQPTIVRDLKFKMLEKTGQLCTSCPLEQTARFLKFVENKLVRQHLAEIFRSKSLIVTYSTRTKDLITYGFSQEDVDSAVDIISSEVMEKSVKLDSKSTGVLNSKEFEDLVDGIRKQLIPCDVVAVDSEIEVLTIRNHWLGIDAKIKQFLDNCTIFERFVPVRDGVIDVLNNFVKSDVVAIQSDLRPFSVKISLTVATGNSGYCVSGTSEGIKKAKASMTQLIDKVIVVDRVLEEPSLVRFYRSSTNREKAVGTVIGKGVIVKFPNDTQPSKLKVYSKAQIKPGKVINLMVGNIVECPADVLVNAANSRMQPGSGVAGAIAEAGGSDIERECREYVKKNGELRCGEVFMSNAGRMPFKKIIHTVAPIWKGGQTDDHDLQMAVDAALRKIDDERFGSVAFPALGCGNYGFPVEQASRIILETIFKSLVSQLRHVKEINVVANAEVIVKFHEALCRMTYVDKIQSANFNDDSEYSEEAFDLSDCEGDAAAAAAAAADFTSDRFTGDTTDHSRSFRTQEGLTVCLVKGSIARQKADVLFCSADKELTLSSGLLASAMSEVAGPGLATECKKRFPNGIDYGQIIDVDAGNLTCRRVYIGACRRYDGNEYGNAVKTLRQLVKSSLDLASRSSMNSIFFPSIGTGSLKIPADIVARVMLEEIIDFSTCSRGRTSLSTVAIVVYPDDRQTLEAFESQFQKPNGDAIRADNERGQRRGDQQKNPSSEILKYMVGDIELSVKCGDITTERCGAIVNNTNATFDLNYGALTKAIVKAAGDSILTRLEKLDKDIAVTKGGRLPCERIFHLFAEPTVNSWKSVIGRCFDEAEGLKVDSLSLPPLGTGFSKASSASDMAEAIFDEVKRFSGRSPRHLQRIIIVIKESSMFDEFVSAIGKNAKLSGTQRLSSAGASIELQDIRFVPKISTRKTKPPPEQTKSNSVVSSMVIWLFSMSSSSIEMANQEIDRLHTTARQTKKLADDLVLNCLSTLTKNQEREIKAIARRHNVSIDINKQTGIVLDGFGESVTQAVEETYKVLLNAVTFEKSRQEHELLARQAVWQYSNGSGFVKYDIYATGLLEKAYLTKQTIVDWTERESNVTHRVSLTEWTDKLGSGKVHNVQRYEPDKVNVPVRWDPMPPTEVAKLVMLSPTSEEYLTVEKNLKATGQVKCIVKIERIQNPRLYKLYMTQKLQMDKKYGRTVQTEQRLWHGTNSDNVQNINEKNFNRSYSGVHGVSIGNGVYFALKSSYSLTGYCPADANGKKYIYQARVLSGKIGPGKSGLKEPPAGYDSVGNTDMVVVFFDYQTYPEYLITFK